MENTINFDEANYVNCLKQFIGSKGCLFLNGGTYEFRIGIESPSSQMDTLEKVNDDYAIFSGSHGQGNYLKFFPLSVLSLSRYRVNSVLSKRNEQEE